MILSKTCEYAVRASLYIAQQSKSGQRSGVKDISEGIDAPESFVAKILQILSKSGVVQSIKGPGGGFYMDEEKQKASVADIVRAIDGGEIFEHCALGLKLCNDNRPCPLHNGYKCIRKELKALLEGTAINQVAEGLDMQLSFLKS